MLTKLPNYSTTSSDPLWIPDRPPSLVTNYRIGYQGHFHKTKIPGPDCLRAESKKPKVSAYLSTLPLSPPESFADSESGKHWLADTFRSKEVKWRRGNNLHLSKEPFDVISHYQLNYPPKRFDERKNYVPKHVPLKTEEKFNCISTYNTDFLNSEYDKDDICFKLQRPKAQDILKWNTEKPFANLVNRNRKSLPPLDSSTTYRSEFQFQHTSFPKFFKSIENNSPKHYLPFDCKSSYQSDYNASVFGKKDPDEIRISSSGFLNREFNDNQLNLSPYFESQQPVFYTVDD